jgi:hypothetical protein
VCATTAIHRMTRKPCASCSPAGGRLSSFSCAVAEPASSGCAAGSWTQRERAQVVAQEATLQAVLGLETLREPAQFGAWLHSIGANLARYRLRQKRRRPLLSLVPPEQVPQSALQLRIPELVARSSELGGIGTDTGQEHLVCELPQDHPGQGSGEREDGRTV